MKRLLSILRRLLPVALVLLLLALLAALVPMRQVDSSEMSWSIQEGDYVWIVPDRVRKADVVLLEDPLEPGRMVLRRVVAEAGTKVRIEDNGVRVNGKKIRQVEMGVDGEDHIYKEVISSRAGPGDPYFVRVGKDGGAWDLGGKVEVPEGHWFVLADDRDGALDSRWWGPISEERIQGVVRAHWARTPDAWRFDKSFQIVRPEE